MPISDANFPEEVREYRRALTQFVDEQGFSNVEFIESADPWVNEINDDYFVAYEAVFSPKDLEHAFLEIWVTADGYVGIMFERRARIAERLGVKDRLPPEPCAAGQEPVSIPVGELLAFARLVAQGKVFVKARSSFGWLGRTRAVVSKKSFESVGARNVRLWDWLSVMTDEKIARLESNLVAFQPW